MELWKDIRGFEGWYQVSDYGNVRRIAPVNGAKRCKNLKPWKSTRGYYYVTLNVRCIKTVFRLNRLVAEYFLPPKTESQTDVNHIDGDKGNNAASNLEWCTRKENMEHAIRTGLFVPRRVADNG